MASHHVVFSHGLESGPWGTKISAMSEVAKSEGWNVDSVDYRGVNDPRDRVTRLLRPAAAGRDRFLLGEWDPDWQHLDQVAIPPWRALQILTQFGSCLGRALLLFDEWVMLRPHPPWSREFGQAAALPSNTKSCILPRVAWSLEP